MYYTLNLMDLACVAIIVMGFTAFAKMLPKNKRGTNATLQAIADQRKRLAVYGALLVGLCIICAAPSLTYFLDHSKTIDEDEAHDVAAINDSEEDHFNPPDLTALLKSGNEEQLIDYLKQIGSSEMNGWNSDTIRLDHEGSRPLSSIYCQGPEKEQSLRLTNLTSTAEVDQISISTYVQAGSADQALDLVEAEFNLPAHKSSNARYSTSQPYEGSQGVSFECMYRDDLPWKISGSIHKADTYRGEDAYFTSIQLVRYITA